MLFRSMGNLIYSLPVLLLLFNLGSIAAGWYQREKLFVKRVGVDICDEVKINYVKLDPLLQSTRDLRYSSAQFGK